MKNILIVKYGALGDVIRTSYILPGLLQKYPEARLLWLTSPESLNLMRFNPYLDSLYTPSHMADTLRKTDIDLVISLDDELEVLNTVNSLSYHRLIGAHFKEGNAVYTDEAAEWFDMGLISKYGKEQADELKKMNRREHNQILSDMLDISIDKPFFYNSKNIEERIGSRFNASYFNVGINSGAGERWTSKQLPLDETVKLTNMILARKFENKLTRVYLLGGKKEAERHLIVRNAINSDRLFDAGHDNSLLEFAAIVKNCDYVITSDSLALHCAISQKTRNLSFFAPTSAAEIGTFGTGVKVTSLASDYCTYKKDADNSTITSDRIIEKMLHHLMV